MRTEGRQLREDAVEALVSALGEAQLRSPERPGTSGGDVDLDGPGGPLLLRVEAMSVGDRARVGALISARRSVGPDDERHGKEIVVVVADQLSDDARSLLRATDGWGYLDRRGALWLRSPGLLVNDTSLPALGRIRRSASGPIRGRVGLGVALYLLMRPPSWGMSVRTIATAVGASPSTVHDALSRLRGQALVERDGSPLLPDLFEAVSGVWRPERISVLREPVPGDGDLGLGFVHSGDVSASGWAVGGDIAAAALGAPIVVTSGSPPDLYVPTPALLTKAVRRLGECSYAKRGATLAVAPSPLVTSTRQHTGSRTPWLHWPVVHAVVVALDLAQDASRGREILSQWAGPGADRVW